MNQTLLTQWRRLIFPPDGLPVRAGEQLKSGNRYPDVKGIPDWAAHLAGQRTYAVNPCYPGPDGDRCRWAVLDLDEHGDSLPKARALLAVCKAAGLEARAAWSGGKGCHVWLFFEPAPVGVVRAVLAKLRAAVPFQGETIPGENQRAKLPPAFHQEAGFWAFWFDTLPDVPPALENAPTGFLDGQAGILAGVVPTAVPTLVAYANVGSDRREPEPEADLIPALGKLGGALPPCIRALIERGAQTALGSWDKNALTLARYVKAAGLFPEAGAALLETMADNTGPDFPTGKDREAQRRHWRSIRDPGPFGCGFILQARRALGFRCADCAARPPGVKAGANKAESPGAQAGPVPDNTPEAAGAALELEPTLADSLLQLALQSGMPEARIDPAIFPDVALPDTADPRTGKPIMAAIHALGWAAIGAGTRTAAAMLNGIDRQRDPPTPPVKQALAALVSRLLGLSPAPESEAAALVERAADLTARRELLAALGAGTTGTQQRKPLMTVIGGLHETTARLQAATGTAWGAPLTAYAAELLEGLVTTDRPTVPTPFDSLNDLLGGGLHGGKLYVLAAPPGGGKTTLASQIADHAAAAGIPTAYAAMEMGRGQLFDYALARRLGMNSAKVEARHFRHSESDRAALAQAAKAYLETIAPWLSVVEGDWNTTAATLNGWVAQARARYGITPTAPVLVVVDYLQLLNTGDEKLDSGGANETPKVSQVAVQLKQLARDSGAAVLALSDVVKSEQGAAMKGAEFTLNLLRGSNRIAHAADVVLALYSEAAAADGGKAQADPWDLLAQKYQDSPRARDFARALDDLRHAHPTGGPGAVVRARLELLKNRGGRGRGSQVLLYERAYHRFKGLSVPGQDAAEGRG